MEQVQDPNAPLFGLNIDPVIKAHLNETARWGKFLSIVGFICCVLIVIGGIWVVSVVGSLDRSTSLNPAFSMSGFGPALAVVYVLIAILYFFPCLFLMRFSNKMRTALATDNQADLTYAFQNLKVLFRYVGILTIIVLAFYVLALLFGGLGMMLGSR